MMLKQGLKLNRPLPPKGKNKKVISVTKDELGGRIMKQFVEQQKFNYLINDGSGDKKSKRYQARIQHLKEVSQVDEIAVFPFVSNSDVFDL